MLFFYIIIILYILYYYIIYIYVYIYTYLLNIFHFRVNNQKRNFSIYKNDEFIKSKNVYSFTILQLQSFYSFLKSIFKEILRFYKDRL